MTALRAGTRGAIAAATEGAGAVAQVRIDGLDEDVVKFHALRARAQGRSLEERLRELVTDSARLSREELLAEADRIRAANRPPPPGQRWPTVEEMLREDRDSR